MRYQYILYYTEGSFMTPAFLYFVLSGTSHCSLERQKAKAQQGAQVLRETMSPFSSAPSPGPSRTSSRMCWSSLT